MVSLCFCAAGADIGKEVGEISMAGHWIIWRAAFRVREICNGFGGRKVYGFSWIQNGSTQKSSHPVCNDWRTHAADPFAKRYGNCVGFYGFYCRLFFREGMSPMLIIMGVIAAIIFILTLLVDQNYLFIGIGVILVSAIMLGRKLKRIGLLTAAALLVCGVRRCRLRGKQRA